MKTWGDILKESIETKKIKVVETHKLIHEVFNCIKNIGKEKYNIELTDKDFRDPIVEEKKIYEELDKINEVEEILRKKENVKKDPTKDVKINETNTVEKNQPKTGNFFFSEEQQKLIVSDLGSSHFQLLSLLKLKQK